MLQADGEAGVVGDGTDAGQHAGHEGDPVERVVPDREGLPRAAEQHLLVGDQAAERGRRARGCRRRRRRGRRRGRSWWRRAPGGRPASRRAAATSCAVRRAVPEGASALSGWCSSTTSTDSKCGAASTANRIISRAPMEKFGATRTPTSGAAASHRRTVSSRSSSKPVVPTTAWMPWAMQCSRLAITASGWVKSTATCGAGGLEGAEVVADVDLRDQLEPGRLLDAAADLRCRPCRGRPARRP